MADSNEGQKPQRIYNFNAQVGQFIEHVDTVNFSLTGDGQFRFENVGQIGEKKRPTVQTFVAACEQTMREGLWYGGTGWAVVYRVWQTAGYDGSYSDFVRQVQKWPWTYGPDYQPTDDNVGKPLRDGKMMAPIGEWKVSGVTPRNCCLAERLLTILSII